jgi:hypothetical protein
MFRFIFAIQTIGETKTKFKRPETGIIAARAASSSPRLVEQAVVNVHSETDNGPHQRASGWNTARSCRLEPVLAFHRPEDVRPPLEDCR